MRKELLRKLLTGEGSHIHPSLAFEGLERTTAGRRPEVAPAW